MALIKDKTKIGFKGGGTLWLNEDLDETVMPDVPNTQGTWFEVGYLDEEGTQFIDQSDVEEVRDESGRLIKTGSRNRRVAIVARLLQTGKDEIDFINQAVGKEYQVYYKIYLEDGNEQRWHFPRARIIPKMELTFRNEKRVIMMEIKILKKLSESYYSIIETGSYYDSAIYDQSIYA